MSAEYVAGFMDGEGMISAKLRNRRGRTEIQLAVSIFNTNVEALEAIQSSFGGRIRQRENPRRLIYNLNWDRKSELARLLRAIAPFLIVKRRQATALLEFLEGRDETRRVRYTERDFALVEEVQAANSESRWKASP